VGDRLPWRAAKVHRLTLYGHPAHRVEYALGPVEVVDADVDAVFDVVVHFQNEHALYLALLQAINGADREQLLRIAKTALRAWP
jgi:hypothetical protein